MRKMLFALLAFCVSTPVLSAGNTVGKVISVRVDQTGNAMIFFAQSLEGTRPSCVISPYANALAINTNTAGGKSILAMALAAKAMDSTISVIGLGTCNIFGSSVEDWDYGVVQ